MIYKNPFRNDHKAPLERTVAEKALKALNDIRADDNLKRLAKKKKNAKRSSR